LRISGRGRSPVTDIQGVYTSSGALDRARAQQRALRSLKVKPSISIYMYIYTHLLYIYIHVHIHTPIDGYIISYYIHTCVHMYT